MALGGRLIDYGGQSLALISLSQMAQRGVMPRPHHFCAQDVGALQPVKMRRRAMGAGGTTFQWILGHRRCLLRLNCLSEIDENHSPLLFR